MNQHALAWLQLRSGEQRLPRGQRSQRHGRCADVMKRVRFEREFWFANDDIISVRAVARWIGKAVNLVADLESSLGRGTRSDFFYRARDIPPENEREFLRPEVSHAAFTNFPIDRVHSRCVDSHENFARLWLRTRCIFVLQDFRAAVVVNSTRFHGLAHNWLPVDCCVGRHIAFRETCKCVPVLSPDWRQHRSQSQGDPFTCFGRILNLLEELLPDRIVECRNCLCSSGQISAQRHIQVAEFRYACR